MDKNDQKDYVNIFERAIDMLLIVFVGCYKYAVWGHFWPKDRGSKQDIADPLIFSDQLPFLEFWGRF